MTDILRAKAPSTTLSEIDIMANNETWRVVDAGGSNSARKKWIHCYQDVSAIMYMVDVSSYPFIDCYHIFSFV